MNKLKEIESQIVTRMQFLNLDFLDKADLKQFIIESCVEYARSKVPNETMSTTDSSLEAQNEGYNLCRDDMIYSIDQDLNHLTTKL